MRSELALKREYSRIAAERARYLKIRGRLLYESEMARFTVLSACYQTLAWMLEPNTCAPSKCYPRRKAGR